MANLRVGFFLKNHGCCSVDFSMAFSTNPGVGGTEWEFYKAALTLGQRGMIEPVMLLEVDVPPGCCPLPYYVTPSLKDAVRLAETIGLDYVIHSIRDVERVETQVRRIVWIHNDEGERVMNIHASSPSVSAFVFNSKTVYRRYVFNRPVSRKAYLCYNFLPSFPKRRERDPASLSPNVCFIGSIHFDKGLHILTAAWPAVVSKVPNAHLYVVGSGKLYEKDAVLGPRGIADPTYEEMVFRPLLCEDVLGSVSFLGTVNIDQTHLLETIKVGVPNPSGLTETFCLSATDFARYQVPVVSCNKFALRETVPAKTCLRFKTTDDLSRRIIRLLENNELNRRKGDNAYKLAAQKYNDDVCIMQWKALFSRRRHLFLFLYISRFCEAFRARVIRFFF